MSKNIKYKYSLYYDLNWAFNTIKNKKWIESKGLNFFMPSLFRMIKLWFCQPDGPKIETDIDITCYWISAGTWGAYRPPNKIFICPYKIPNLGKVIRHEITHLRYNEDVSGMNHEDKESHINKKESDDFRY